MLVVGYWDVIINELVVRKRNRKDKIVKLDKL